MAILVTRGTDIRWSVAYLLLITLILLFFATGHFLIAVFITLLLMLVWSIGSTFYKAKSMVRVVQGISDDLKGDVFKVRYL
jgi:hypothetical protein